MNDAETTLVTRIADCLDRRRGALTDVTRVVNSAKSTLLLQAACQMAVPMIYAHWEGYAKEVLQLYVEHLESIKLPQDQAASALLAYSWESSFAKLRDKLTHGKKEELVNRFFDCRGEAIHFDKKQREIDTKSNLFFHVMEGLATALCLDISSLKSHKINLDALVNRRNGIAHGGRDQAMDENDVANYRALVLTLMSELESTLLAAISNQSYRRPTALGPTVASPA